MAEEMTRLSRCALVAAAVTVCASLAEAQELTRAPGVVAGIVTDTAGRPIDAEVYLTALKQRVSTGPDGRFRFVDVKAGRYEIGARRVGFFPRMMRVTVSDSGIALSIQLVPLPHRLPPVITAASRFGLSGVVGDSSLRPLANAEIEVIAANRRARTDSAGEFFVSLKPGKHMVKVSREGFATRMVSVTVPTDGGRHMKVWLTPSDEGTANKDAYALQSMQRRVIRRNPVYSALFSREDLEKVGEKKLDAVASFGSARRINENCPVTLPQYTDPFSDLSRSSEPGQYGTIPLWALDAADLEFLEVYGAKQARPTRTTIRGRAQPQVMKTDTDACPTIIGWLRK